MDYIAIKNFHKYQHFKVGTASNMIWFKWYIKSLSDYKFSRLNCYTRWIYVGLVCMACKTDNCIPYDLNWLLIQITFDSNNTELEKALKMLFESELIMIGDINNINAHNEVKKKEPIELGDYETKTIQQKIVIAYKMLKGFNREDREWDKRNFARCTKQANHIADALNNDWETIKRFMIETADWLSKFTDAWTIDALVRHVDDWKLKKEKGGIKSGTVNN